VPTYGAAYDVHYPGFTEILATLVMQATYLSQLNVCIKASLSLFKRDSSVAISEWRACIPQASRQICQNLSDLKEISFFQHQIVPSASSDGMFGLCANHMQLDMHPRCFTERQGAWSATRDAKGHQCQHRLFFALPDN
jgi:hypothetical protein